VEAGYEVVTYDAPGHGRSSGGHSSLPEKAAAVVAMAHHLGGVRAIIAHSAGAAAVTAALGRPGTPLPVQRLVYVAPSVDMIDVTRRFVRTVGFTPVIAERMREGIEKRFGVRFKELQSLDIAPRMEHPLLVIHDREDQDALVAEGEALSRLWPGAAFVGTEGLGHRRILRDTAVTAQAVSFVQGGRGRGPVPRREACSDLPAV
jgi:pimeloyl-ACP methyl ester carboxylesterase